jgi:hypothetical protein
LAAAILMLELGGHRRFDLLPRQPSCQHCQGVVQIDHCVNAAAEEVDCLHTQIPQKVSAPLTFVERFGGHDLHKKMSFHEGWRGFAGASN